MSMFNGRKRSEDKLSSWLQEFRLKRANKLLTIIEFFVIGGIILAFILPAFN